MRSRNTKNNLNYDEAELISCLDDSDEVCNVVLPDDILREIISYSYSSKSIITLKNSSTFLQNLVNEKVSQDSNNLPINIDISQLLLEKNPFQMKYFDKQSKKNTKQFHDDIRRLCSLLEIYLKLNGSFSIDELKTENIGWMSEYDYSEFERAPYLLQRRLMNILKQFHSTNYSFCGALLKPSRFIKSFSNRFDSIKVLDLHKIKPLKVLNLSTIVFPALNNLQTLKWHHANILFLKKLANIKKLKHLIITVHIKGRPIVDNFSILSKFIKLKEFYFGLTVPHNPSRMHMSELLLLYQSFWNKKLKDEEIPSVTVHGKTFSDHLSAHPKLRNIGFWNAPELFFIKMAERSLEFKRVKFGYLTQDLQCLCSIDSVLQALFRLEEAEDIDVYPKITNLELNLHAMPVVALEYYIPNIMDRINMNPHIKTLSLFVNCIYNASMDSSWILDSKKTKKKRKNYQLNSTYTHFDLHFNGYCELTDLELQLPTTLQSCSISLNLPEKKSSQKAVRSLIEFIFKISDLNSFPDLEEFHVQVWGIRCMEVIIDAVSERLNSLRRLSIICMPVNEDRSVCKNLLKKISNSCSNLEQFNVSADFLCLLIDEDKRKGANWNDGIRKLSKKCKFNLEVMQITIGKLPESNNYSVKPTYNVEYVDESDNESEQEVVCIDDDSDDEAETSLYADYDEEIEVEYEESPDELEILEEKLEKETNRRHNKWRKQNSKKRIEDVSFVTDVDDENDIIDFDNLDEEDQEEEDDSEKGRDGFFDDEAEEASDDEDDGDDEEMVEEYIYDDEEEEEDDEDDEDDIDSSDESEHVEEDDESLEVEGRFSDDDDEDEDDIRNRLQFDSEMNGVAKRKRSERESKLQSKRRKIIVSDEEDDKGEQAGGCGEIGFIV